MHKISPAQSKAGRAFLEWSQEDLAKRANISLSTVRSFENGILPRTSTINQIYLTLEEAGIEFTEGSGVRLRNEYVRVYFGHDSIDQFFDDVTKTVKTRSGDVVFVTQSQNIMLHCCGITPNNRLERLEELNKTTSVKCIIPDASSSILVPEIEFRTLPKHYTGPWSYCVFGDKYAHILQEGHSSFIFVVFHKPIAAHDYHNHFLSLWNQALPLKVPTMGQERALKVANGVQISSY